MKWLASDFLKRARAWSLCFLGLCLLTGCRSENEYQAALSQKSQAELEKKELQQLIASRDKEMEDLRMQMAVLQERLNSRDDQDKLDYMAVTESLRGSTPEVAREAYLAFARKHPSSPLSLHAKAEADSLSRQVEDAHKQQEASQALQQKQEEIRKEAIFKKLSQGEASLDEVRFYLLGSSQEKIIRLFGRPDQRGTNEAWEYWQYVRNRFVYDGVTGKMLGATVRFQQGRVVDVSTLQ